MPNMSYCKFQNTAEDLRDCLEDIGEPLSESEHRARLHIFRMVGQIVDKYCPIDIQRKEIREALSIIAKNLPQE